MDTVSKLGFLMRYGIVGATGGAVQTSTLYLWIDVLHLETHYLLGAVAGFCMALLVTFTLQKYWTFREHTHTEIQKQFVLYTTIALITLGLNILLLHLGKIFLENLGFDFFDGWYLVVQIAIIGALAVVSFLANYFLTFQENRSTTMDT